MSTNFLKLEELSTKDLDSLEREKTMFFLTVSPIENHGAHLPLGMDILEGNAICKGVAEKYKNEHPDWNIVMCPILTVGFGLMPGIGSIDIRQSVIKDLLTDYFSSLTKRGFKYIVVSGFHGGPRHLVAVDEAVHNVNRKYKSKIVAPFGYYVSNLKSGKLGLPSETLNNIFNEHKSDMHGGLLETSFMLHLRPDLVKDYKNLEDIDIGKKNLIKKAGEFKKALKYGYMGFPSKANKEIGEELLQNSIDAFYNILMKSLDDKKHLKSIRSRDTRYPFMRTGFSKKVISLALWLTGTALIGLMIKNIEKKYES